ncbi:hypothetical protein GY15_21800 [Delftia sp. 670]|nr:hypothetical protein GY15_21800 [Delftia sp. 670]
MAVQPGERAQQGGLARAGLAQQGHELARGNVQVDGVQHVLAAKAAREALQPHGARGGVMAHDPSDLR